MRRWLGAVLGIAARDPAPALLLASASGWLALAWLSAGQSVAMHHPGHAHGMTVAPSHGPLASWAAMILAMAPVLLVREVGAIRRGGLRRTRHLSTASFLVGYGAVWLLVGIIVLPLVRLVPAFPGGVAVALLATVAWHCSPARQRRLNACHRLRRLRVFGAAAQADACRYGLATGGHCVAACAPPMLLVMMLGSHHLVGMALVAALATVERYLPPGPPSWRLPLWPAPQPAWRAARRAADRPG